MTNEPIRSSIGEAKRKRGHINGTVAPTVKLLFRFGECLPSTEFLAFVCFVIIVVVVDKVVFEHCFILKRYPI